MDPAKIQELEDQLGHPFNDKRLLIRALTHPTFSNVESMKKGEAKRDCPHQETYTTLGDAILKAGLILLLVDCDVKTKGNITILKEDLEKNLKLADVGERLKLLENNLILHKIGNETKVQEGAVTYRSDTVEAIIAAIFIDSGDSMTETKKCIEKIFGPEFDELKKELLNPQ
jgi:ribonuclease III